MKKEDLPFFGTSFKFSGQAMLGGANFLTDLQAFGAEGKDLMNEETVEFLFPYVRISASRRVEAPSRHRRDSCPSHNEVGG